MRRQAFIAIVMLIGLFLQPLSARATPPETPLGLKGIVDPLRRAFTLLWEPVKHDAGGVPLPDPAGYNVYRRSDPRGTPAKINPYVLPAPIFADRIDGAVFYYSVRAVDKFGVESDESFLVDSTDQANILVMAQDGLTHIVIPGRIGDLLRPAHNKYRVPLGITLSDAAGEEGGGIVRDMKFQLIRGDTKEEVSDLVFAEPDVQIHLGYRLVAGQVAIGAPGLAASQALSPTGATPDQLSLYWFNGVTWIKLGGTHNAAGQTVGVTSAHLGSYQLRIAAPASNLALAKANVFPGLFTPNGDGFNDRVYLVLENPNNASLQGEIFELSGRFVAALPPPTQTLGVSSTLTWAGEDTQGSVVPSGLYLYRIQGEGRVITGTVSVAR